MQRHDERPKKHKRYESLQAFVVRAPQDAVGAANVFNHELCGNPIRLQSINLPGFGLIRLEQSSSPKPTLWVTSPIVHAPSSVHPVRRGQQTKLVFFQVPETKTILDSHNQPFSVYTQRHRAHHCTHVIIRPFERWHMKNMQNHLQNIHIVIISCLWIPDPSFPHFRPCFIECLHLQATNNQSIPSP